MKKKQDADAKQKLKVDKLGKYKAKQPLFKMIAELDRVKSQIKADKIPAALAAANPIDEVLGSLREAVDEVDNTFSVQATAAAKVLLVKATSVKKAMQAFV